MNKTLKFDTHLIELIRSGKKTNTWRLFDDKDLKAGDVVDFLDTNTKQKFATAKLTKVAEKALKDLDDHDWSGHERYAKDADLYTYYTQAYKQPITPSSRLKVVWYEIIQWNSTTPTS